MSIPNNSSDDLVRLAGHVASGLIPRRDVYDPEIIARIAVKVAKLILAEIVKEENDIS